MGILDDAKNLSAKTVNRVVDPIPLNWLKVLIACLVCLTILFSVISYRINNLEHSQNFEEGVREGRSEAAHYLLHRYGEEDVLRYWEWVEEKE